jgi:DNA invertase Pin-like site-specific DNA recombinase
MPIRAFVYCRISTSEARQPLSLGAQLAACDEEIARRGWVRGDVARETASGKSLRLRPILGRTLGLLEPGDVLLVARLDRLSRHAGDFYGLMDRANREGWSIVCLDPMVDMTTPFGRATAGFAAVFAQLERELIGQRVRDSIEARRRLGTYRSPAEWMRAPEQTERRVVELASQGLGPTAICRRLALEGVSPPRAERWGRRTVQLMLARARREGRLPQAAEHPAAADVGPRSAG